MERNDLIDAIFLKLEDLPYRKYYSTFYRFRHKYTNEQLQQIYNNPDEFYHFN